MTLDEMRELLAIIIARQETTGIQIQRLQELTLIDRQNRELEAHRQAERSAALDRQWQETTRQWQETTRQWQENDRRWQEAERRFVEMKAEEVQRSTELDRRFAEMKAEEVQRSAELDRRFADQGDRFELLHATIEALGVQQEAAYRQAEIDRAEFRSGLNDTLQYLRERFNGHGTGN